MVPRSRYGELACVGSIPWGSPTSGTSRSSVEFRVRSGTSRRPRVSSRSNSRSSVAFGPSRLDDGNRILRHLAGLASILRGTSGRSRSTDAAPRSSTTSCGWIRGFGRSYSVMITRVDFPVSRGSVSERVGPGLLLAQLTLRAIPRPFLPSPRRMTSRIAVPASRCGFRRRAAGILPACAGKSA